jgi:hypothetical protein
MQLKLLGLFRFFHETQQFFEVFEIPRTGASVILIFFIKYPNPVILLILKMFKYPEPVVFSLCFFFQIIQNIWVLPKNHQIPTPTLVFFLSTTTPVSETNQWCAKYVPIGSPNCCSQ